MFKSILTLLIPLTLLGCSEVTSNYQGKGNMKDWMKEQAQSTGLELRWNMHGDYDIADLHKQELSPLPLGQKVKLLQRRMSLDNLNKKLEWPISHQGQQYPYNIMVATAVCKDTLVFAEVPDLELYTKNLLEGKYEGCIPVDANLGFKPAPLSTAPVIPTSNMPAVSNNPATLPPFAAPPPIAGAPANSQVSIPTGQFKIPLMGDPEREVPQMEAPKK